MIAYAVQERRKIQITLDIECFDDIDIDNIDWASVLNLQPNENVEVKVYEDNLFNVSLN